MPWSMFSFFNLSQQKMGYPIVGLGEFRATWDQKSSNLPPRFTKVHQAGGKRPNSNSAFPTTMVVRVDQHFLYQLCNKSRYAEII